MTTGRSNAEVQDRRSAGDPGGLNTFCLRSGLLGPDFLTHIRNISPDVKGIPRCGWNTSDEGQIRTIKKIKSVPRPSSQPWRTPRGRRTDSSRTSRPPEDWESHLRSPKENNFLSQSPWGEGVGG